MPNYFNQTILWVRTKDPIFPYESRVKQGTVKIKVNDWPKKETIYTLYLNNKPIKNFNQWPKSWLGRTLKNDIKHIAIWYVKLIPEFFKRFYYGIGYHLRKK